MKNFIVLIVAILFLSFGAEAHDFQMDEDLNLDTMDRIAKACKRELDVMDIAYENFMRNKSRSNEKKIDKARKAFDACADKVPRHR